MTPSLERLAEPFDGYMMSIDPGQTTGYAYWEGLTRVAVGEGNLSNIEVFLDAYQIDQLVFENYRVYQGREKVQGNLYTPRLIGRLEAWAEHANVPVAKFMAAPVKRFCNDQKLKDWGLYVPGMGHAMDSSRHGAYWLVFRKDSA